MSHYFSSDNNGDNSSNNNDNNLASLFSTSIHPHRQRGMDSASAVRADNEDDGMNDMNGPTLPSARKLLVLVGSIVLIVSLVGPGGIVMTMLFYDYDEYGDYNSNSNSNSNTRSHSIVHGDKHHAVNHRNKATGSKTHGKFGTRRKKQHQNRHNYRSDNEQSSRQEQVINDQVDKIGQNTPTVKGTRISESNSNEINGPIHSIMKDAISNIDKVFASSTESLDDDSEASIPIVHSNETLPINANALDAYTNSLPASDALECRASVIAFVINATDVKDECEGLRKAFDKTCSVNSNVGRRLERGSFWAWGWTSRFHRWMRRNDAFLFAEEEVATDHAWNQAKLLIDSGVDLQRLRWELMGPHYQTQRRLTTLDPNIPLEASANPISERKDKDLPVTNEDPTPPKHEDDTPKISLLIPTAEDHIADETLNDALLLQSKHDSPPQPPPNSSPNPPETELNHTETAIAARDASESADAIRTATEAVKNMMIDPKSLEARTCCASILSVFHEHCDPTATGEDYSDRRLLVIVFVITVCGMVKSLIRYFEVRWLPEAGGCISVGVVGYLVLQNFSYVQYAFDGDMFLRIMVPPIVFEAAIKINKRSFRRHALPITIYAIVGTMMSTALTATILHKGSAMAPWCTTIPVKESLIFGSLISSIDPIAVLSVLNNMGMTDTDTIYVLIFGESLLNDGIAIVLFQTLVHFLDESLVIDGEAVIDAILHFVVVALGSLTIGILSGACATVYFAMMHGCQTPMVELIMFFCWAFIPYFICDMVEWSGIVAIVANGFVMDLYVVGQKPAHGGSNSVEDDIDFLVNGNGNNNDGGSNRGRTNPQQCRSFFNYEGHLSALADTHVHFVIEIFATLMETAIFAYLGLFLFSPRYHWNAYLTVISIFATVMGRVIMIPTLSHISNVINRTRNRACLPSGNEANVHVDRRMQLVLIFAGLRGAMSFALVEHIPMFDTITGQGSRLKPELKAMTSASIIFTVFVLGGATSYLMERIGYTISKEQDVVEVTPLVRNTKQLTPTSKTVRSSRDEHTRSSSSCSVRQRGSGNLR